MNLRPPEIARVDRLTLKLQVIEELSFVLLQVMEYAASISIFSNSVQFILLP